jgi:hypothetical protein
MAVETSGAALRRIERLLAEGSISGLSDRPLPHLSIQGRDANAFELLVGRRGTMVLSIGRGILSDHDAAEDGFQASSLVLVNEAGKFEGTSRFAAGGRAAAALPRTEWGRPRDAGWEHKEAPESRSRHD